MTSTRLVGLHASLTTRLDAVGLSMMAIALETLPDDPAQRARILRRMQRNAWMLRRGLGSGEGLSHHLAGFGDLQAMAVCSALHAHPSAKGAVGRAGFLLSVHPGDAAALVGLHNAAVDAGLHVAIPHAWIGAPGLGSHSDGAGDLPYPVRGWNTLLAEKKTLNSHEGLATETADALQRVVGHCAGEGLPLACDLGWLGWAPSQKGMAGCLEALSWISCFVADADAWETRGDRVQADRAIRAAEERMALLRL